MYLIQIIQLLNFRKMLPSSVTEILSAYEKILNLPEDKAEEIGRTIPIPHFDSSVILDLCRCTMSVFQSKDTLVETISPIYILGDIHGNLFDLLRILIYIKSPPKSRILFLGDYVDRGQFSIEVITLLFALQCAFPDHIVMLRGNHEFDSVNQVYGFYEEVSTQIGNDVFWNEINRVFQWMPIAAVVSGKIFCVHGGLSPSMNNPNQLSNLKRPISHYEDDIIGDVLWSDPTATDKDYIRSTRGSGVAFGPSSVVKFLTEAKLEHIVRGHQCVPLGILKFAGDSLYTVFSSSNYEDYGANRAGLMFVNGNDEIQVFSLPPLTIPKREDTFFSNCNEEEERMKAEQKVEKRCIALNVKHAELLIENKSQKCLPVITQRRALMNMGRSLSYDILRSKSSTTKLPSLHPIYK
ncbi:Ser/Thr protein phosphatase [Tritrichomonas foetus]|uniref:Serine/threonine-protein phosphatase n=1 Tax=Tritrichomonas foetus TaxID=1144522 RepID=A0A1J4KAB7_9EUKA|nr:Ser/Thr protein phosphatase [Tritrichomonas foetus]|eukprot:OHT08163.1 Ser/Thr protein phosphatase [Tritrichomonas foetus]